MMEWKDIDCFTLLALTSLGDVSPTHDAKEKMVKLVCDNRKTYLTSKEIREISRSLTKVAKWLDQRAIEDDMKGKNT